MQQEYLPISPAYQLSNRHGHPLCNAVHCRKHTLLQEAYGAKWCVLHLERMNDLRIRDGGDANVRDVRLEELRLRKDAYPRNWALRAPLSHPKKPLRPLLILDPRTRQAISLSE